MYFVFISIFIGKYFIYNFARSDGFRIASAFDKIIKPTGFLYALMNSFRQYLVDPTVEMIGMKPFDLLIISLGKGTGYLNSIENVNSILSGVIDETEYNLMKLRLFNNLCFEVDYFVTIEECDNFAEGLTKQGILALISYYISSIMNLLREYENGIKTAEECLNSKELFELCIVTYDL